MAQKNEKKTTTAGQLANSFKIAFSMYSKIPMPQSEWSKENMRYVMCFSSVNRSGHWIFKLDLGNICRTVCTQP
ncbi:hypothetical protein [Blautia stercoris]